VKWSGIIERLAWGGMGVGREADGRLILLEAPLALFPGEKVEAEVVWKARHGEGLVTAWVRRDNRRVRAGCPVAGVCGGCDLWEAGPLAGDLKQDMVKDLLSRQLPDAPAWRWLEAPDSARRHRIQLHWNGLGELGFYKRNSHSVVPVNGCPAAAPALSAAIPRLQEALAAKILPTKPQRWELATGTPAGEVYAISELGKTYHLQPDGWKPSDQGILHSFPVAPDREVRLRHRAGGFFQVCPPWAWAAFGDVLSAWAIHGDTLYDLYGGVGFFSALLGKAFRQRVLVENVEPAVAWAQRNLAALELAATCVTADAAEWVGEGLGAAADVILLDPPRVGLAPELCAKLQSAGAGTLVLVGCDGAAFCRDLKRLAPAWVLQDLAVLDLFPLTTHMEFVARLTRSDRATEGRLLAD
jgi:23S rRNA (uracil1939-C5)-methyltransferase